jgi:putative Mg2+ transporter-C (MgtC) family protein
LGGVLFTNLTLRPLAYCLHSALPEPVQSETHCEIQLACSPSVTGQTRAINGESNDNTGRTNLRAESTTAGRNKEALEQVVMRLSTEEDVSTWSWSVVGSTIE